MSTAARSLPRWHRGLELTWVLGAMALAFSPTAAWMVDRWNAPGSLYGHGFLVPLVSGALLWRDRRELARRAHGGSWAGLLLLIPALCMQLGAVILGIDSLSGIALWLCLPGWIWWSWGRATMVRAAFPLAFLLFAIPAPMVLLDEAALVLKEWVLASNASVLALFGCELKISGSSLLLPDDGGRLLVDDECSGLRSLVALVALGVLAAGTSSSLRRPGRALMLLAAVPVALLANGVRVLLLSTLALNGGTELARRWHDPSGWVVYAVAIGGYVLLERWLARRRWFGRAPR